MTKPESSRSPQEPLSHPRFRLTLKYIFTDNIRICRNKWDNVFQKKEITYICIGDPAMGIFDQLEMEFILSSVKLLTRMLLYNRDKLSNPATYLPSPAPSPQSCEAE